MLKKDQYQTSMKCGGEEFLRALILHPVSNFHLGVAKVSFYVSHFVGTILCHLNFVVLMGSGALMLV